VRSWQAVIQADEAIDGRGGSASVVVVCKAKIWLVGCDGWLAVVKPANTSFTSWHLGGDSGIAGHGQLGRTTKQKDIYLYARERDVTQKQAKNKKSILRHQRGDSSHFDDGVLPGYWFGF